jgi:hypothetical protein
MTSYAKLKKNKKNLKQKRELLCLYHCKRIERNIFKTIEPLMKTSLNHQKISNKNRRLARIFNFKFAIVTASLCLSVALLLPVIKNLAGHNHPMPAGQFQADARTMAAAVRYLLASESTNNKPVQFKDKPVAFAQIKSGRSLEMSGTSSNQTEIRTDAATNLPAQS